MRSMQVVLTALGLAVTLRPAWAAWPDGGRAISAAPNSQLDSRAVSDGSGGAIVVYIDAGSGVVDLIAQHVLASGELDPGWPIQGRPLLTNAAALPAPTQGFPGIVSDGAGGAIVAWVDGRSLDTGVDIFAQHVLASGVIDPNWPANGAPLTRAPGVQNNLAIVSDGAGGAIVTWMDGRGGGTGINIFAQHVLSSGFADPDWKLDGASVCSAPGRQAEPKIDTDGAGGAIITWFDPRSTVSGFDIYAQHMLSSGIPDLDWPLDGQAICTAPGAQLQPAIVSDGAGGAVIAWSDSREVEAHIFAHHVFSRGTLDGAFPVDGLPVAIAPIEQQHAIMVSDGAGGAIVSWEDQRSGVHNMFAHHVLVSGAVDARWPVNGIALSTRPKEQTAGVIVQDGGGGAFVTWVDDGTDIFAQHVLGSGRLDPGFPANGQLVIASPNVETSPRMVEATAGGAIITWTDFRTGDTSDIYALQLLTLITTGVDDPPGGREVSFAAPRPNPAVAGVTLRFALPRETRVDLAIYDTAGRRVRELVSGAQPAGDHTVGWDLRDQAGRRVGAGLFFARLDAGGQVLMQKLATLR